MKQVLQSPKKGSPFVADVPPPQCGAGEVLVATRASLISAGTEKMLIDFAQKSMLGKAKERPDLAKKVLDKLKRDGIVPTARSVFAQLEQPLPLGYSAAGKVLAVGSNLQNQYSVGDDVVMAGAGIANHAEVNAVPKNLVAPMPKGVTYEEASFCTLGAIALHGVRNAELTLGDRVLVMGLGLVGQLAAQLAAISGARVMAVDFAPDRIKLAEEIGAIEKAVNLGDGNPQGAIDTFTNGRGFDAVLICAATDSPEPINNAAVWARDRAKVVLVGKVGTEIPYAEYMKKELTVRISRSYGPGRYDPNYENKGQSYPVGYVPWTERDNLAEIVQLIADEKLNVKDLISHDFGIEEAEQAYALITAGDVPCMGVVLTYPENKNALKQTRIAVQPAATNKETLGVAAIGAGAFSKSVLFPAMAAQTGVAFTGVASKGGSSAKAAADRFDFAFATSENKDIFNDGVTDAVLITTRHNTHAQLVQDALKAKKHVFVEKPLALTLEDLAAVYKAWKKNPHTLLVGYNRRFAPQIKNLLAKLPEDGARQVLVRVNAGQLPSGNWQSDAAIGGGRLLGEVCHFLDLALALTQRKPTQIFAQQGEGQDNYTIQLTFEDGSLATVFYTSDGDSSYSKERVEVYAGGVIGVIDNFMNAFITRGGRKRKLGGSNLISGQNKGHGAELEAFVQGCRTGSMPIPAEELFLSASLPLLAQESIESGAPVKIEAWS